MVHGWACDPVSPERRVTVKVFFSGRPIGETDAMCFRPDLVAASVGDGSGYYAFSFPVPENLRYITGYELTFSAELDGRHVELAGSPFRVSERDASAYRIYGDVRAPHQTQLKILEMDSGGGADWLMNSGLALLNQCSCCREPRTVFVLGHPRSGTSMVARTLHVLGLPMGLPRGYCHANFEDTDFVDAFIARHPQLDVLDKLIEERDEAHVSWGVKVPAALNYLPYLLRHSRNPHVILVFRDALATAMRENLAVDQDMFAAFDSVLSYQQEMVRFLQHTDVPCFLVSYEKAIINPSRFCEALIEFTGIEPQMNAIESALEQINPNQHDYVEEVGSVRQSLGLAFQREQHCRPCSVDRADLVIHEA